MRKRLAKAKLLLINMLSKLKAGKILDTGTDLVVEERLEVAPVEGTANLGVISPRPYKYIPHEWREAIKPFLVFEAWDRTSSGREIVMLVIAALRIDPRLEREARALAAGGWRVTIIAPDLSTPPATEVPLDWGPDVQFHLLPWHASDYVNNEPWLAGELMYEAAMTHTPFAYHCHDLTTVLVGLRAARDSGARLICDHHEWYSENVSWNISRAAWEPHEPEKRFFFRFIERHTIRRADCTITVSQAIAHELEILGRRPVGSIKVVRNIPDLTTNSLSDAYPPLKEQFNLPADAFVVLYQGGTGPSRLLEPVIRALALAPKVTFVIRGPFLDLFGEGYLSVAREAGVEARLILADPVTSRDVVVAARGADVGLWTLPNLSKNFYLALPNKVFEYLASGLPLLVAAFPEASRIVSELDVGLAFDPYDPASIAAQMNRYVEEPGFSAARRAAVPYALTALDAPHEWDRLRNIYQELPK